MVIGVLGKGGVGKSTIASQLALYFSANGKKVLGIDADYNMDFIFNVFGGNAPKTIPFFGVSKQSMKEHIGADHAALYGDMVLAQSEQQFVFSKDCVDTFTSLFITSVTKNLSVLVCGPETDEVLYGVTCGHSLSAPLKMYLPLLDVGDGATVILDEKAGADGANTGIISGCDKVLIITDASLHGTKVALQIAKLADFFEVPYMFVANKVQNEDDVAYIKQLLNTNDVYVFNTDGAIARTPSIISTSNEGFFAECENSLSGNSDNALRFERSRKKFAIQQEFTK